MKERVKINAQRSKLFEVIRHYAKEGHKGHKGHIYSVHAILSEGNQYDLWIPAYGTVE